MEAVNTFAGGINRDINKSTLPSNKYRDAKNIRIITQGLDSTGAITNANGNAFSFTIPDTSNVIKLANASGIVSFTLDNSTTFVPISVSTSIGEEYTQIAAAINADATLNTLGIKAAASSTYLLIWSIIGINNLTITPTINISLLVNITQTGSPYISAQVSPIIIGSTPLRDDFIIFTTTDTSRNPGGHDPTLSPTASSVGQIWRLSYDPISFSTQLTLLYNNYTDFTTYHPIPPSAAEGRYETGSIKRVYWTDNYNQLRQFNTTGINAFATDPSILNIQPAADFDVPILQKINPSGGNTKIGVYQVAYRLKNTGGAVTAYSKCSNIVPLINNTAPTVPFRNYVGAPVATTAQPKTITWNIDNLDTDYQFIEVVVLFRETRTDIPTIDQIFEEPVPSNGSFTFTYTGFETTIPVDLNQFLAQPGAFTHCKTIQSKTNQLLAGNVRNTTFDVNFDARAYRWPHKTSLNYSATQTIVNNSQGTPLIVDKTLGTFPDQWNVPETHDAVNPDQSTQNKDSYRFQSDGLTIGGEGPNIKYKFNTRWFVGDANLAAGTGGVGFGNMSLDTGVGPIGMNARFTNPTTGPFSLQQNSFKNNNFYDSFKSEYISSAFKSYQHDEVVPFAIRFFDKAGRAGFAKWIGDIKMPLIYESIDNGITSYSTYPITRITTIGTYSQQEIGLLLPEFTVTIPPDLQDKISGWEIIRCERTTADKSVLAAGTLHPIVFDAPGVTYYMQPFDDYSVSTETEIMGFKSPEFSFETFPGYQTGDSIKVLATEKVSFVTNSTTPAPPDHFQIQKNYTTIYPGASIGNSTTVANKNKERFLDQAVPLSLNGSGVINTFSILNKVQYKLGNTQYSVGDDIIALNWQTDTPIVAPPNGLDKYYAIYKRNLSLQYGGNSYSQRAGRQYISCGQYQEMTSTSPLNFTVEIAGGDIYTCVFDNQRILKDWNSPAPGPGDFRSSTSQFYPVQTTINTEWRYANSVNHVGFTNAGVGEDLGDDYLMNFAFSAEDNTKKAFPKPLQFTDVQEYDNRVHISSVKINGEITDSWGIFPTLDYIDCEGNKGPITALQLFKDNIFVIQQNGVCVLPVNQRVLIPDNSSSTLQLGTGTGLGKPVYVSTLEGSRHQWSVITSDSGIYFFDVKSKAIIRVKGQAEPISVTEGLESYFPVVITGSLITTDNPINDTLLDPRAGVLATWDPVYYEVLYTFHDVNSGVKNASTVCFSELINAFTTFYDFTPAIYLTDKRILLSSLDGKSVWLHNEGNPGQFYGTNYNSSVSFLVNPNTTQTKVFDNFEWETAVTDGNANILNETWSSIRVYNDHQNTDFQTLVPNTNIRRRERNWQMALPRNLVLKGLTSIDVLDPINLSPAQLYTDRIRAKSIQVDLRFTNFVNNAYKQLICPYIKTIYRTSTR